MIAILKLIQYKMNKIIFNYENQDLEIQCKPEDQMKKYFKILDKRLELTLKIFFSIITEILLMKI